MSSLIAILISLGIETCGTDEERNAVARDATSHTHVTEVITKAAKQPTSRTVHATTSNHRPRQTPSATARSTAKTSCRNARHVKAQRRRAVQKKHTAPTVSPRTAPSRTNALRRPSPPTKAPIVGTQRNVTRRNGTWVPEPIRADPRIIAPRVSSPFGGFPR